MHELQIHLKSFDTHSLQVTMNTLKELSSFFHIHFVKEIYLPLHIKRITVIRSPHIHKKSREQYEFRTHKRTLSFCSGNEHYLSFFLEICKKMHFPGVQIQCILKMTLPLQIESTAV